MVVAVNPLQRRPRDVFRRRIQGVDPLAVGGQPRHEGHGLVGPLGPRPPEPGPVGGVGLGRSAAGGELLVDLSREGAQALDGLAFIGSLDRPVGVEFFVAAGSRHLRGHCAPRILRAGQELLRHEDVRDLPRPRHACVAEQERHRAAVGKDPREEHIRVLSRAEHPEDLDDRLRGVCEFVDHGGVGLLAGQLVRAGRRCARRARLGDKPGVGFADDGRRLDVLARRRQSQQGPLPGGVLGGVDRPVLRDHDGDVVFPAVGGDGKPEDLLVPGAADRERTVDLRLSASEPSHSVEPCQEVGGVEAESFRLVHSVAFH